MRKLTACSMAADLFLDTSGLYALGDRHDSSREKVLKLVPTRVSAGARLVITDYVLDEAYTLAKARAGSHAALRLVELVDLSAGFRMEWIGPDRFQSAKLYFRKHADHGYSFTDCTSFVVMQELRLNEALTTDRHFKEAGFRALLLTG